MVDVNGLNMEMSYCELGKRLYCENIQEDDSKKLQFVVKGMILAFPQCPVYSATGSSAVAQIPEDEQSVDYAVRALLEGVGAAANEAGHVKNAEYISRVIKERFGKTD